jgi:hypothetical protein
MDEVTLKTRADRLHDLRDKAEAERADLAEAIREAAAGGMRQVDIVRATGYTREQVRLIVAGKTR